MVKSIHKEEEKKAPIAKKCRKKTETFSVYIYRVLQKVHPDIGISKKSMRIMNGFINDILKKSCLEAGKFAKYRKKLTLSSREVQISIRRILLGKLAEQAMSEGIKAVTKFAN